MKTYDTIVNQLKSIYYQKVSLLKDEDLDDILKIRNKEDYIEQLIIIKNDVECKTYKSAMCLKKVIRCNAQDLDLTCEIIEPIPKPMPMRWSE